MEPIGCAIRVRIRWIENQPREQGCRMTSTTQDRHGPDPAASPDRNVQDYVFDSLVPYFSAALLAGLIAGYEWLEYLADIPPHPVLFTVAAIVVLAVAGQRVVRAGRKVRATRVPVAGGTVVRRYLDQLRGQRAQVFSDLAAGERFRLDHVVVHPSGIYAINTGIGSAPEEPDSAIRFDGERILVNGKPAKDDPIREARMAAAWLESLLRESTGRAWPVRTVVVFPGWHIEHTAEARGSDVWVVNLRTLPALIVHSARQLPEGDVRRAADRLVQLERTRSG